MLISLNSSLKLKQEAKFRFGHLGTSGLILIFANCSFLLYKNHDFQSFYGRKCILKLILALSSYLFKLLDSLNYSSRQVSNWGRG